MDEPTLLGDFEIHGHFFVPESPQQQVGGTLTYSRLNGLQLDLLNTLSSTRPNSPAPYPVILGISRDNQKITLFECLMRKYSISFGGGSHTAPSILIPTFALIGGHFPRDSGFHMIDLNTTSLNEWLSLRFYDSEFISDSEPAEWARISVHLPSIPARRVDSWEGSIEFGFNVRGPDVASADKIDVSRVGFLRFKADTDRSVDDILRFAWSASKLLSLLIGSPSVLRMIRVRQRDATPITKPVYMYFNLHSDVELKPRHAGEMITTFPQLGDEFPQIIERWSEVEAKYIDATNLYFSVTHSNLPYVEVPFLFLTQAIEAFHRATECNTYVPNDEYETYRKSISGGGSA